MPNYTPTIAIHGGAGTIRKSLMSDDQEQTYMDALEYARDLGYNILERGGDALEAVEGAVVALEDCDLFNAGKGSVFNAQGKHEMDASIMDGKTLQGGAVAAISGIKNPIILAHKVLQFSDHILLIGEGALAFAKPYELEYEDDSYFHTDHRYEQWQKIKGTDSFQLDHTDGEKPYLGTVGAVALDQKGNLAAATSTGGMTNKKYGRVGDSPIIGSGTYANNKTCAVSCTGSGEYLMRGVTAYDISCMMEYKNLSLAEAAYTSVMKKLVDLGGDGGVVAVDRKGNITMPFNSDGMYRACRSEDFQMVAIYKE